MGFAEKLRKLDAQRLQKFARATVQSSGRLVFSTEAIKFLDLSEDKSIVLFDTEEGDLGATIAPKGVIDGFVLKCNGPYFYISLRWYLKQVGIDYSQQKIVFDISDTGEKMEGRTLYRFERRVLPDKPKQLPVSKASVDLVGHEDTSPLAESSIT